MPSDKKLPLSAEPAPATALETAADPLLSERPGRVHWVVVMTRSPQPKDKTPPGATLLTRWWHPRDRNWSENAFESLDHAIRLFVARREDFSRPSTEQILHEVGLTPEDVADLMNRVDREGDAPP